MIFAPLLSSIGTFIPIYLAAGYEKYTVKEAVRRMADPSHVFVQSIGLLIHNLDGLAKSPIKSMSYEGLDVDCEIV